MTHPAGPPQTAPSRPPAAAGVDAHRPRDAAPGGGAAPREHAVPCRYCRRPTWRADALCERHMGRVPRYRWYSDDLGSEVVECTLCGVYTTSPVLSELVRWSGVTHPQACTGATA